MSFLVSHFKCSNPRYSLRMQPGVKVLINLGSIHYEIPKYHVAQTRQDGRSSRVGFRELWTKRAIYTLLPLILYLTMSRTKFASLQASG